MRANKSTNIRYTSCGKRMGGQADKCRRGCAHKVVTGGVRADTSVRTHCMKTGQLVGFHVQPTDSRMTETTNEIMPIFQHLPPTV
jgi:hypothetical protein